MMAAKGVATAGRILRESGPLALARASMEKVQVWWRHGELLEFAKYAGRPSPVARLQGCRFSLDSPALTDAVRYLLLSGKHEKPERQLVTRFVDTTLPVVELGGCIGVVSCITNRLLRDPSKHVVVEANPSMLPLLRENRERNRCRFTVVPAAIAYGASAVEFHQDDNPLMSGVDRGVGGTVAVRATTLGEIVAGFEFERCTVICDIEGAERDLVKFDARVLSEHVELIVLEIHERLIGAEETRAMLKELRCAGFVELARCWETVVFRNTARRSS